MTGFDSLLRMGHRMGHRMGRSSLAVAVLITALLPAMASFGEPVSLGTELVPATADPGVVEEVLEQTRVRTTPEDVSWQRYAVDLGRALLGPLIRGFGGAFSGFSVSEGALWWLIWILFGSILLVVLILVARSLRRRPAGNPGSDADVLQAAPPPAPAEDAGYWRRELEARLAAGDLAAALAALWWWLARRVGGPEVDPSWTGSELVRRSGRRELLPAVRHLDALTYGGREVRSEDVQSLLQRLEGEVA